MSIYKTIFVATFDEKMIQNCPFKPTMFDPVQEELVQCLALDLDCPTGRRVVSSSTLFLRASTKQKIVNYDY